MRHVRPGENILDILTASTLNEIADAVNAVRVGGRLGSRTPTTVNTDAGVVLVKNTCGSDVPRFGILAVTGPLYTPAQNLTEFMNRLVLIGVAPSTAYAGRFVVTQEAIAAGRIGKAVMMGVTPAYVTMTSATDACAECGTSMSALTSGASGAPILWKAGTTGTVWAVVKIGGGSGSIVGTHANPRTLSGSGTTAATDTWDVTAQGTNDGVLLSVVTREVFDGTSLIAFRRQLGIDSIGRVYLIGPETSTPIFTTELCG